jgi:carboxyl-terminal processing protease
MMRQSKYALWLILLLAVLIGGTTMVSTAETRSPSAETNEIYRQLDLFGEVLELVRSDFVEKPDDAKLIEAALKGMLEALDPHSTYLNLKQYRETQVRDRGEFGGVGIDLTMENGLLMVASSIEDTPAARVGIRAGDFIAAVNGKEIHGLTLQEVTERIRGPVNSAIILTVVRKGVDDPFDVKLVRGAIHINPVKYSAEGDVGYIRIISFNEHTTDNLQKAVNDLKEEIGPRLKGYIIDLRNNPGGLLDQAISVSDAFLDQGAIVLTKGRDFEDIQRANARPGDITDGAKLVVLINGGSASASEIVAGALRDHRRATIVGTRSFGKGSVQTIIPLGHRGALRLTTARYYTPSGRSIQAKGIEPDEMVEEQLSDKLKDKVAAQSTLNEASLRGHLKGEGEDKDGKLEEESGSSSYVNLDKDKDTQLQYALDLLQGIRPANAQLKKAEDDPGMADAY